MKCTFATPKPRPVVKHNPLITISFCLNLALSGLAIQQLRKIVSPMPPATTPTTGKATNVSAVVSLPAITYPDASTTCITNRFAWSKVEAEDFAQLAANLRAIGCPEKTVRDVVAARARRSLEGLSRSAEPKLSFWTAGLRRAHAQCEAEREVATARTEMLASVDRALGPDVFTEDGRLMEDFVEQAIARFLGGPISEEKFLRFAVRLARQEARRKELRKQTQGVPLEEDEVVLENLGRQFHRELAAVLLPAELEEFTARTAMMKLTDQVCFEATDLSPMEIRTVALIRARFNDPAMGEWFNSNSLNDHQEAQFASALREFLGESRSTQIERAKDGDFKILFALGREYNLPPGVAVNAFEVRQLTAREVARVRADKSLSAAERQPRFAQMQTEAQEAVLKTLGADACAQYLNCGGAWLTNLGGL